MNNWTITNLDKAPAMTQTATPFSGTFEEAIDQLAWAKQEAVEWRDKYNKLLNETLADSERTTTAMLMLALNGNLKIDHQTKGGGK